MKNKLVAAVAAVVIVAAGVGAYVTNRPSSTPSTTVPAQSQAASKIRFSVGGKQVSYDGVAGQTALATLQSLEKITTKDTSYGTMVTGIRGMESQDGKNYWAFYVNGKYADEGAGSYKAKAGDKITWKLEDIKQ